MGRLGVGNRLVPGADGRARSRKRAGSRCCAQHTQLEIGHMHSAVP